MEAYELKTFSIYMLGIDVLHKVLKNNNFHENLSVFFGLFWDVEGDILKLSCNKPQNLFFLPSPMCQDTLCQML